MADVEKIVQSADNLFKAGNFTEAQKACIEALNRDSKNYRALTCLGNIALLSNRLSDAEKWFTEATRLKPKEASLKSSLAEVYYRRDEFQKAAPLFRSIGRKPAAQKLESFKDVSPYEVEATVDVTKLNFVMTDPLPVVQVQVNDSEFVHFFIDTGGAEVIIDDEFAKEIGAVRFGSEKSDFAGGKEAVYHHGRVDAIKLGQFTLKNLPAHVMDVRRFSQPVFGGTRVDGVIGTVPLYHFIATIDYPKRQLILRRREDRILSQVEREATKQGSIVIPFWMAGDHCMVAWGTVNSIGPMLFLVDTGLAGSGFLCTESTLRKTGIRLQKDKAQEGIGGGGNVLAIPFTANELTLGDAKENNVGGIYMDGMSHLEVDFGFHVGGIISHAFFRQYALTLDFDGMRYFLQRRDAC